MEELNKLFQVELTGLSKLDKQMFTLTLEMLNTYDDLDTDDLGKNQLNIISNVVLNTYILNNIKENSKSMIRSCEMLENFHGWCNLNSINIKLIEYFTATRFAELFGKRFEQKRFSQGKFWKNIEIKKNTNDTNDINSISTRVENIRKSYFGIKFDLLINDQLNTNCKYLNSNVNQQDNFVTESIDSTSVNTNKFILTEDQSVIMPVQNERKYLNIIEFCELNNTKLKHLTSCTDNLLFLFDGANGKSKIDVIPFLKKYDNVFDNYNYYDVQQNRVETADVQIHKILNTFVTSRQTPHINLMIAEYYTDIKPFLNLDNGIILNNDKYYDDFVSNYKKQTYHDMCLLKITEDCNEGDFLSFVKKYKKSFLPTHWKVLFFQLLSVLAVIQSKYPSFRHNDLRPKNIYIEKIHNTISTYNYKIHKKIYKVPNIGYIIKLNNFDFANIPNIADNKKIELNWVKSTGISATENKYYDVHFFFNCMTKHIPNFMNDIYIPNDVKTFINTIIPAHYLEHDTEFVGHLGRLLVDDEFTTPAEILSTNPYFAEFRC
jgi:hypothetical protein